MRLLAATLTATSVGLALGLALGVVPHRWAGRKRQASGQSQWLAQAGLDVRPAQFWLASVGAALATFLVVSVVAGVWVVAVVPAVLVGLLPRTYFGRYRRKRLFEVQQAWPDGLRDLVASISAGMSLGRALEQLSVSGPAPLRAAFSRFPFMARSSGVVAALEAIRSDLADPTSDRVIEVLIMGHERGGAIVPDLLRDLAEATARDVWAVEEITTQALEHKINAGVVFVLPWLVLTAMTARQGLFRDFYSTPRGWLVVAIGGVLSLVGALWLSRMGRQPDEPRVLAGGAAP